MSITESVIKVVKQEIISWDCTSRISHPFNSCNTSDYELEMKATRRVEIPEHQIFCLTRDRLQNTKGSYFVVFSSCCVMKKTT